MLRSSRTIRALVMIVAVAVAALGGAPLPGRGSDHADVVGVLDHRDLDLTDVFVFPAADPNDVVLAMDVHPFIPPAMGPSTFFDPNVLYQFKIDNVGDRIEHLVIQFRADASGPEQKIVMYGPAPPNVVGTRSTIVAQRAAVLYNEPTGLESGMRLFAGPREDPFYFDLEQFFRAFPSRDVRAAPGAGAIAPGVLPTTAPSERIAPCFRTPGADFFAGFNVLSIVLELPRRMLAPPRGQLGVIHVWATTSAPASDGTYAQVERLGKPALKLIAQPPARRALTDRRTPRDDRYLFADLFQFAITARPQGAGRSAAIGSALQRLLLPDTLSANLAARGPARYLAVETQGKIAFPTGVVRSLPKGVLPGVQRSLGNPYRRFGGRDPSSPVMDVTLGLIFGSFIPKLGLAPDDGAEVECLTSDNVVPHRHTTRSFPYLGPPQ